MDFESFLGSPSIFPWLLQCHQEVHASQRRQRAEAARFASTTCAHALKVRW